MANKITHQMQNLDVLLMLHYYENKVITIPPEYAAYMWLSADIEAILVEYGMDEYSTIMAIINTSPCADEILSRFINVDKIFEAVEIRQDFDAALSKVKQGEELSSKIGWGFSSRDIRELALLHKKRKHRKKIEDLLTECNFHTECSDFIEGKYDQYINKEV